MKRAVPAILLLFIAASCAPGDPPGGGASPALDGASSGASRRPAALRGVRAMAAARSVVTFTALPDRPSLPPMVGEDGPGPVDMELPVGRELRASGPTVVAAPARVSPEPPVPWSPQPASSFLAIKDNNKLFPPDTHGAVGPSRLMTTLNTEVAVHDRSGKQLYKASLGTFWKGHYKHRPFDPRIHYDPFAKRWITVACADSRSANSAMLVAVSQTSDPLGKWNRYKLDADPANKHWVDYPNVGFNKRWIVVQANMFPNSGSAQPYSRIWVMDKADLMAGGAGKHTVLTTTTLGYTQSPAITHSATLDPMYLLNVWNSSKGCVRLFTITGSLGQEKLTAGTQYCAASGWAASPKGRADLAPQKGTSKKVQVNDARMHRVVWRNGYLWAAHMIILGSPTRTAIQWWKIDPTKAGAQVGRIDDATGKVFRAFPSIAVNKHEDLLIGYARFSAAEHPGAAYRFRHGSDSGMTLQPEVVFRPGRATYYKSGSGRNRWGDYSAAVVDPADDINLWTIQEYADTTNRWATWWAGLELRPVKAGGACTKDTECRTDHCVDGVCCDTACGDGITTDCQACSVKAGAAKDGACGPLAKGVTCRKATGPCDVAEGCDGAATACPADLLQPAGASCRASQGPCDVAESCDGKLSSCPADGFAAAGITCRAAAGACDVADQCDGAGPACPADKVQVVGITCRKAAGSCDLAENCDGTSAACPADTVSPVGALCRKAAGACDVAETCDGAGGACPADTVKPKGTVCRALTDVDCDYEELCDGAAAACPADKFEPDGTPCWQGVGACKAKKCRLLPPDAGPDLGARPDLTPTPDLPPPPGPDLGPDSGPEPGGGDEGCSCSSTGGLAGGAPVAALALLWLLWGRAGRRTFVDL